MVNGVVLPRASQQILYHLLNNRFYNSTNCKFYIFHDFAKNFYRFLYYIIGLFGFIIDIYVVFCDSIILWGEASKGGDRRLRKPEVRGRPGPRGFISRDPAMMPKGIGVRGRR